MGGVSVVDYQRITYEHTRSPSYNDRDPLPSLSTGTYACILSQRNLATDASSEEYKSHSAHELSHGLADDLPDV